MSRRVAAALVGLAAGMLVCIMVAIDTLPDLDLGRLPAILAVDAVVLNLRHACEWASDAACGEDSRRGLGVPADRSDASAISNGSRSSRPRQRSECVAW